MNMKTMKHLFALAAATLLAFGAQAAATDNKWKGGASGTWVDEDATNWELAWDYKYRANITNDVTLAISGTINLRGIKNNGHDVILEGASGTSSDKLDFYTGNNVGNELSGSGTYTVKNVALNGRNNDKQTVSVTSEVIVPEGYTMWNESDKDTSYFVWGEASKLSGAGTVIVTKDKSGFEFHGDNSGFTGEFQLNGIDANNHTSWHSETAGSEYAKWSIGAGSSSYVGVFLENGGTVKFGELTGTGMLTNGYPEVSTTLEVGALGTDFTCGVNVDGMSVKKVGAGTMTWSGSNVSNLTVAGGCVAFAAETVVDYPITIDGGTLAVNLSSVTKRNIPVTVLTVADSTTLDLSTVSFTGVPDGYTAIRDTTDPTKLVVTIAANDAYVWTGNGSDNKWSTLDNWKIADGTAVSAYPISAKTVIFPQTLAEAEVSLDVSEGTDKNNSYILAGGTVAFNCATTLIGTSSKVHLRPLTVLGSGVISLKNACFMTVNYKTFTINNDLVILPTDGDDPWSDYSEMYVRGGKGNYVLNGKLTGSGRLKFVTDGNDNEYYTINGDTSDFCGKLYIGRKTLLGKDVLDFSQAIIEIDDDVGGLQVQENATASILKIGALTGDGVLKQYTKNVFTLEVGLADDATYTGTLVGSAGWTVKKVGTGCQTFTSEAMTNNVDLTAGELGVPAGKKFGTVALNGGKFKFTIPYEEAWTNGTTNVLFTCTDGVAAGTAVNYVTLDMSAFEKTFSVRYDNSEANTLKVSLAPAVPVWNGPVGGRWSEASNWLVDGKAALAAPGADNAVVIGAGAVIAVEADRQFGTITSDPTAQLAVMFTDKVLTFTAPTDFTGTIVAAGPFTMTGEGGVYTATRVAGEFVWSGAAADGQWSTAANWAVGGCSVDVVPTVSDNVILEKDAEISTSEGDGYASNMTVKASITLTGGGTLYFGPRSDTAKITANVEGTGELTLSGITLYSGFKTVLVSLPLEIVSNTVNQLKCCAVKISGTFYGHGFKLTGKVTGSGKIEITQNTGSYNLGTGVELNGDFSEFSGQVEYYLGCSSSSGKKSYQQRAVDTIHTNSTSALARWDIYADHYSDVDVGRDDGNYFADADATYKFGSLQLRLPSTKNDKNYKDNVTLEVGALDEDSKILYSWKSAENAGVNWIAPTATWTQDAAKQAFLNVLGGGNVYVTHANTLPTALTFANNGGTLKVGYDMTETEPGVTNAVPVDPSAKIVDSTATIAFDDQGTNATWATALAASNVGGFTKKGTGTLTLAAIPEYSGVTKVEAGTLVVPDGTKVALDIASAGTLTGATVTNVVFTSPETTTTVVTEATEVKAYGSPVDCSNITVDLTEKTDWTKGATCYVVTSAGIVAGTSVRKPVKSQLLLPENQKNKWVLRVVSLPGQGQVLAVVPHGGFTLTIR